MTLADQPAPLPVPPPEDERWMEEFHILATSSQRRPQTLKYGDAFAVLDDYGDIVNGDHSPNGFYYKDTRHLSQLKLLLNGHRPLLLSSTVQDDNTVLTIDLANPDIYQDKQLILSRETLHVIRSKFLWQEACYERIALHNFGDQPCKTNIALRFASDFADLFEVRGMERARHGSCVSQQTASSIIFRYTGLDQIDRTTRIDFQPVPNFLADKLALFQFDLEPGGRASLFFTVRCDDVKEVVQPGSFYSTMRQARRALRASLNRIPVILTPNAIAESCFSRARADLLMLMTDKPEGPYPYAGIPWFSTAFGRDGIITALQMLWLDPAIAKGVLKFLAATQATEEIPEQEAEPGKILHETRQGEMARLGEVPFRFYYGSVDSTPLFVLLAGRYFERTGDRETIEAILPNIEAALRWIDIYGDADKDGFVEYTTREGKGLRNQGWKDSRDSISHVDGYLAEGAIALCEVQAYVYAARLSAAKLYRALGQDEHANALEQQACALREHFEAAFWCDDLGTYALALDGEKRQCRVRSSNAGHALFAGIASPGHAERLVATLFSRESYSGWGIRTLATSERRFNPMSYHNGSVWPHDNAMIASGLARYGFKSHAARLFLNLFEAVQHMDLLRLPELFCGFRRRPNRPPTLYPVACAPQAWASAAFFSCLEACLGINCLQSTKEIRFEKPCLPSFLEEVQFSGLRIGDARADIIMRRYNDNVSVNVLSRIGDMRVIVVN